MHSNTLVNIIAVVKVVPQLNLTSARSEGTSATLPPAAVTPAANVTISQAASTNKDSNGESR